jgi:peptidyl-Lys metalloendopeptidase
MFSKSVRSTFIALAVSISAPTQSLSVKVTVYSKILIRIIRMFIGLFQVRSGGRRYCVKVLNDPHGPLNELPDDTSVINASKGAQSSFMGMKLKYVPETAVGVGAYSTLAPGES